MSPSKIRIFVAITLMLVMLAGAAMAQSTNGTIAGVVTDKSGAVVSAAKVDATGVATVKFGRQSLAIVVNIVSSR